MYAGAELSGGGGGGWFDGVEDGAPPRCTMTLPCPDGAGGLTGARWRVIPGGPELGEGCPPGERPPPCAAMALRRGLFIMVVCVAIVTALAASKRRHRSFSHLQLQLQLRAHT